MKFSKRAVMSILFIVFILLFGIFFWPYILKDIIEPIALVTWVLLRIFVLSVDQKYYWGALIFIAVFFLFRLLPQEQIAVQSGDFSDSNAMMKNIEYWRALFTITGYDAQDEKTLKREFIHLLLSLYASKQGTSTNFRIYDALQRREIPLPEHIRTFLFPDEQEESRWSLKTVIQSVQKTIQKWIRRWTGQETAERNRMINEILSFMETSLEIKNDDGKFTANKY